LAAITGKCPGPSGDTWPWNSTKNAVVSSSRSVTPGAQPSWWNTPDANTSRRTRSGRRNATTSATSAPSLCPARNAGPPTTSSRKAIVSRAISS
jgi:hypothetical protein